MVVLDSGVYSLEIPARDSRSRHPLVAGGDHGLLNRQIVHRRLPPNFIGVVRLDQ